MIPIVFITDERFIMQTGVALTSLLKNKKSDTNYDIYIVVTREASKSAEKLKTIVKAPCRIEIISAELDKYSEIKQLAHIPQACLLKFEICDLIKGYDKLIYLDGDIYIRGDLSELYQLDIGNAYIAGVPSVEMVHSPQKRINAGVMLFDAKSMRDNKLSALLIEKRKELGDRGSMDQQTFNLVMNDKMAFLPYIYNYIPEKMIGRDKRHYPLRSLNKLYNTNYKLRKQMAEDAVILHYATSSKPWMYDFIKLGSEWYCCYMESIFGTEKLVRKSRFDVFREWINRNIIGNNISEIIKLIIQKTNSRRNGANKWG